MGCSKDHSSGFRLVPFKQNKSDSLSFFLTSTFYDRPVVSFRVGVQDYNKPDAFYDILTVAVDSMIQGKPSEGWDS